MKNILFLITVLTLFDIKAQVGFNTNTPHPSSVIEMNADDKGLLIPRMSSLNRRQNIANPANSLLVYDLTEKAFYFREQTANKWTILNPWDQNDTEAADDIYTHSDVRNVGIATNTPQSRLAVSGNVTIGATLAGTTTAPANGLRVQGNTQVDGNVGIGAAPTTARLHVQGNTTITGDLAVTQIVSAASYALNETGSGPVPSGTVVMWAGAPNAIPTGWRLCNGVGTYTDQNGVNRSIPDLRGRFIVGYDNTAVATPANATNKQINYGAIGNTGGENLHQLTIAEMPEHNHTITDPGHTHTVTDNYTTGGSQRAFANVGSDNYTFTSTTQTTSNSTSNITINNAGESTPHENRPPYFVLAYIIKI